MTHTEILRREIGKTTSIREILAEMCRMLLKHWKTGKQKNITYAQFLTRSKALNGPKCGKGETVTSEVDAKHKTQAQYGSPQYNPTSHNTPYHLAAFVEGKKDTW